MSNEKFVNETGVLTIRNWANGKFALDSDLDVLAARVEEIIAEGGEPNVIEIVKVNNSALTPDANKAVNIDLSGYAETSDIPTDLSDLTNTGQDPYATEGYVDQNGGKIDSISIDGTTQTIDANKNVALNLSAYAKSTDLPTKVSDLTNDSNFIDNTVNNLTNYYTKSETYTQSEVDTAISSAVSSVYTYKGSVATYDNLPSSGLTVGDVYDVVDTGMNYAWTGTGWDALGASVDLSNFWNRNNLQAMTVAEINAILNPSSGS